MSIMTRESEAHRNFEKYRPKLGQPPTTTDTKENQSFSAFMQRKKESGIDKSKDLFRDSMNRKGPKDEYD